MLKSVADLTSQDFSKGLNTVNDIFKVGRDQSPNMMDVKINFDGSVEKRLGTNTMNNISLSQTAGTIGVTTAGWASFDFGASALRWYCVAAGTGVYASSNLGLNFFTIATDRTSSYQYFDRSKNVMIMTSDAYDNVLYWSGSGGTYAAFLNISAPLAKYSVNFQGFLVLLNSNLRKRGFFYEDENSQLTGGFNGIITAGGVFDLPSSADDEITAAIVLRKRLYVSTRYRLYRVTYVGGNPDWSFLELKQWGFVPRTVKKIVIRDVGEVIVGESWDRRIRLFDGADDRIISDNIENYNGMCDFAMRQISYAGSGLTTNFAETDPNTQTYRLCTTIGSTSAQTTHFLCLDGRTMAFYPYSNMPFQTMCMAESANQQFLMAVDRSGWIHMVDSGNTDKNATAINDIFDSSFLFEKSPSQLSKMQKVDLYFSVNSTGSIQYFDRTDFRSTFNLRKIINVNSSSLFVQHAESVNTPETANIYQYRLTSSSATTVPWRLNRADYFLTGLGIGKEVKV